MIFRVNVLFILDKFSSLYVCVRRGGGGGVSVRTLCVCRGGRNISRAVVGVGMLVSSVNRTGGWSPTGVSFSTVASVGRGSIRAAIFTTAFRLLERTKINL